jgi:(5-formylfuran-3-yl)methyl phosphate synthase
MTAMLASVTGPEEAEIAIAGGADIIDLKDPSAGPLGALPTERIRATVAAIAGRRLTSAVTGILPEAPSQARSLVGAIAETGVDYVKVGLSPGERREAAVRALSPLGDKAKLVGVLFADRERDLLDLLPQLAEVGFAGVMLDTAEKAGGRLLAHAEVVALAAFVKTAKEHGLLAGLAGGLEEPDVPRLLALGPDLLGFRGALCAAADRRAGIDAARVKAIRRLIPRASLNAPGNVDYRLLSGRFPNSAADEIVSAERIFVRDLVLPVRIGAYSHEKNAPQKVRFDVTVELAPRQGGAKGMQEVVSYDLITDGIKTMVAEGHVDLVETLAERIAAHVLREPRATRVTVRVEKLELGPGGVGVEIVMEGLGRSAEQNPLLAMLDESGKPRA